MTVMIVINMGHVVKGKLVQMISQLRNVLQLEELGILTH